jgi:folate-dependent phosphoribosylglycinamide formyltransferase PurN
MTHFQKMKIESKESIERIQTQIEMIRQESRILSYRIERMTAQRKTLQDEKRVLKSLLLDQSG